MTARQTPSLTLALLAAAILQGGLTLLAGYGGVRLLACHWAAIRPIPGSFCVAGWPTTWTPWLLVAVIACLGLVLATAELRAGWTSLRRSARLVAVLRRARVPSAARLRRAADDLGPAPVDQIDLPQPLALCHGLLRPRIVVSSGLVDALDDLALRAVLTHEAEHARRRDPLRLLALRIAFVAGSLLPAVHTIAEHTRTQCEWHADAAAVDRCGRAALARALHTVLSQPLTPAAADLPAFCSAATRIRLLGAARPPTVHIPRWRLLTSAATLSALAALTWWFWHVNITTAVLTDLPVS